MYWATRRDGLTGKQEKENTMSIFNPNRAAAAVFSLAISAMFFASAIVPGSPAVFA